MKEITEYISEYIDNKVLNEGLVSWVNAFIKKINNTQKKLVQGGKINMLKMDVNKLQFQKEPVKLEYISNDKYTQEIWADKKLGFPMSAEIAKNTKKYIQDIGDTESKPYVYTFYYKSTNTYYAGVIIYDSNIEKVTNYLNIISIETNQVVDNPSDVSKAMFNQFKNIMSEKKKSIIGYSVDIKPFGPEFKNELKNTLTKLGFKESTDSNFSGIYLLEK